MSALLERLGLELPVVQAGMGGGLSTHELAAAVSSAGGLGTIGFLAPDGIREEVAAARRATEAPIAVNLLLPFARGAHFEAASAADVVVTFWGKPERRTGKAWIHQVGSVEEATEARAAGADAVIAQGVESGGHVRGSEPAMEILARVRGALGDDYPVLSAGGIVDSTDVKARLDAGANAVVSGTRFLLSEESGAHDAYKARLLEADETILTELFGAGWPAPTGSSPRSDRPLARQGPARTCLGAGLQSRHGACPLAGAGADAIPHGRDAETGQAGVRAGSGDSRTGPRTCSTQGLSTRASRSVASVR